MMTYPEFLFRKDDEVICPSCKENGFVNEDVLISDERKLVRCSKCGAYSRIENLRLVINSEVENDQETIT